MSAQPPLQERVQAVVETMKTIGENSESDALALLKTKARWAARCLGPFFDLNNALYAGLPAGDQEVTDKDREAFDLVMALHKDLPHYIAGFQGEPDAYESFVNMMVTLRNYARADDTHMIKYGIEQWIPHDPVENPVTPSLAGSKKDNRGWYHPATARALTPLSRLEEFEGNPSEFQDRVQNGTITIGAHEYPSFLYPDGTIYDDQNVEEGLFRGHIFIRALRAIYTGESSALDGYRNAPKASQAEINDMKVVFAEAIGNAAVQAHFSLSSLGSWNEIDKSDFDYFLFFDNCVKLFTEGPEDEWVVNTLKFLTNQLPSLKRRRKRTRDENEIDQGENQTSSILERRAARLAAKEQESREQAENEAREREAAQAREREGELFNEHEPHQVTPPPSSPPERPNRSLSPLISHRDVPPCHSPPSQQSPSPPSHDWTSPIRNRLPAQHRAASRPPVSSTRAPNNADERTPGASAAPSTSTSGGTGGGVQQRPTSTSATLTKGRKTKPRKRKW